jgi:hypothetical protein
MKTSIVLFIAALTISLAQKKNLMTEQLQHVSRTPSAALLNINRMSAWYNDNGQSERNPKTNNSGVSYPRSTSYAIYASGMLMGGFVSDSFPSGPRVTGFSYNPGFEAGAILGVRTGITEDPANPSVRIYRIRNDYPTADLTNDVSETNMIAITSVDSNSINALRDQYKKDWLEWPAQKGAPFYDADHDGKYSPKFEIKNGKEVPILYPDADEPGLAGANQVLWYVANDVVTVQSPWKTKAIGLEMQTTIWGYNSPDDNGLGNSIFKRTRIIYKGSSSTLPNSKITEFYIGQWSDPDLGDAGDDFVGCDSLLGIGYVYNSKTQDAEFSKFGISAPAVGYILLQGPIVKSNDNNAARYDFGWKKGYKNIPMTSFVPYSQSCDIQPPPLANPYEFYQNLRGLPSSPLGPPDPPPFVDPTTKLPTKFVIAGDPVLNTGWLDGTGPSGNCNLGTSPGDRRLLTSSGPFEMSLGDTQEVVYALVGGLGSDRLASITVMKYFMRQSKEYFSYLFPENPVSVKENSSQLPKTFLLAQNYPNPFNPGTMIQFELPSAGFTTLTIYDALGREVEQVVNQNYQAGTHSVRWDAKNKTTGIYFYRLHSGSFVQTKKMIFVK